VSGCDSSTPTRGVTNDCDDAGFASCAAPCGSLTICATLMSGIAAQSINESSERTVREAMRS
jgi:hypothetical protein